MEALSARICQPIRAARERWGITTPLGRPVEPEVNRMYAVLSGPIASGSTPGCPAVVADGSGPKSDSAASSSSGSGRSAASAVRAMIRNGSACSTMAAIRASG